ncbi:MAG: hypothetical protein HQ514_21120 [Rhodospirillales bacterium]|nr:hypothetical protein [Rhodospirillales bacterium]
MPTASPAWQKFPLRAGAFPSLSNRRLLSHQRDQFSRDHDLDKFILDHVTDEEILRARVRATGVDALPLQFERRLIEGLWRADLLRCGFIRETRIDEIVFGIDQKTLLRI